MTSDQNNPCAVPVNPKDELGDGRWMSMHNRYVKEAQTRDDIEVLWIGDSIVLQLQFSKLWSTKLAGLHSANFGIGGDRVENVLWRLQNGELDFNNSKIRAVVLFVGTNNVDSDPNDIADGIFKCVRQIQIKLGQDCNIIVPTLLPRGKFPNHLRKKNSHVNELLLKRFTKFGKNELNAEVVIIDNQLLEVDETLPHYLVHDYLHLTDLGYNKTFGLVYNMLIQVLNKDCA